ncbi:phosphoribosylformylglycinamidine cyclo-ligase [Mycoplasma todarodis]|uniref:Phosphoribosylformylglycinamidine cyclo-ligase n=1 Tax=Mycoplasma todarodis TaxID=1937191 RepID=A0A4R0XNL9_9MOLU|nr:phosphoribosylformylglycinamidine cyclo-ligase [Mycoplasma todarodis]TCG11092.1 phosphoribosylformylglycinamidine cyclo-ligase [Mycoplasma todarodis]
MNKNYKDAGVDIDAGYKTIEGIKPFVKKTMNNNVLSSLGGFGGLYELQKYEKPVLVSGTDGVGTKLLLAIENEQYSIGQDLVAMCVNDIITSGAKPLFFLDYFATGKLEPKVATSVIKSIADACCEVETALIGGETAEMPGMYKTGHFDLAGFAVGVVEKEKMIDINDVLEGDVVIGLDSSGPHSNGFSLIRDVIKGKEVSKEMNQSLLKPTKLYVKPVLEVISKFKINSMAHITGGGFYENLPRSVNKGMGFEIKKESWEIPKIFKEIQKLGNIEEKEMFSVFNMGIGYIMIVKPSESKEIIEFLSRLNTKAQAIGVVTKNPGVIFV